MVRLLVLLALVGGCFDDRYKCKVDADCNVGLGGRCEIDHFCTVTDADCPTGRKYQHAGENGNRCFDDARTLANPCAGGQGPARREGCFEDVCALAPACCDSAWTDACVQLAQEHCKELTCDTRIALTATRQTNANSTSELWEANWDGMTWQVRRRTDLLPPFGWVGPPPADPVGEPRLAGYTGARSIVVGEMRFKTDPARTPTSITSINFDRDGRDTLAIGSVLDGDGADHRIDILKADDDSFRSYAVTTSGALVWGDLDRDTFTDAVARVPNFNQYQFVMNRLDASGVRSLASSTSVNPGNGATDNAPPVRSYEWMDLDGDTLLDLVIFGTEVRVHTDTQEIRENPEVRADCSPPNTALSCAADGEPNFEAQSFCGTTRPSRAANELVISSFPGRKLYRGVYTGGILKTEPLAFPGDGCQCTRTCTGNCPSNPCSCTYGCSTCIPIAAIVARDLDGDHELDLVVIDARLNLYHAFKTGTGFSPWVGPVMMTSMPPPPVEGFPTVSASVSGARL